MKNLILQYLWWLLMGVSVVVAVFAIPLHQEWLIPVAIVGYVVSLYKQIHLVQLVQFSDGKFALRRGVFSKVYFRPTGGIWKQHWISKDDSSFYGCLFSDEDEARQHLGELTAHKTERVVR